MTQQELDKFVEQYQHWLKEDCEGLEDMKANLSRTNLIRVDLNGANLRGANLVSTPTHLKDNGYDATRT